MLKRSSKKFAIMLVLTMLATMFVGVGTASAAGAYRAATIPNVDDSDNQTLGSLIVEIDGGILAKDHSVTFRLPSGFEINDFTVNVPDRFSGNDNELSVTDVAYEKLSDNEIYINLKNAPSNTDGDVAVIKIDFTNVKVESGFSGDIKLVADAPSNSAFPDDEVVIARVPGGKVDLSVSDDENFSDEGIAKIRVKEQTAGSLEQKTDSLKFTLPSGFEFGKVTEETGFVKINDYLFVKKIWGVDPDKVFGTGTVKDDEMEIQVKDDTAEASNYEFAILVQVADENDANEGDVVMKVRGKSDTNVSELIVGVYGDYGTSIKADGDVPTVVAGKISAEIADLKIKETVANSLIDGRKILLELPEGAKWTAVPSSEVDGNVTLEFAGFVGKDGRTIKYNIVRTTSTNSADLVLEDFEVALAPDFEGDLVVTASGSAGVKGEVTLAKVVAPIKVAVSSKENVQIGKTSQKAGDITISEIEVGALNEGKTLIMDLPDGVSFAKTPSVKVTDGDLKLGLVQTQNNDNELSIKIDNDSNDPSTIEITNIEYKVDRTVVEGDIVVKIKGAAVAEVADKAAIEESNLLKDDSKYVVEIEKSTYELEDDYDFFNKSTAAKVINATTVTPAPGEITANAIFTIGSTTYAINGVENTMDVAPYIKDARTYMPIRYVANAMGISDNNIYWDAVNQTVTLAKNNVYVQLKIGSKTILINGVAVTMDVAPEITNDRTMLPARFVAEAFGAVVGWDAALQQVTIGY